jgi:nucleoside-diphosphate-sugar epimerase
MWSKVVTKALITGINGYIAQKLCQKLHERNTQIVGSVRSEDRLKSLTLPSFTPAIVPVLSHKSQWGNALDGCDTVFHLASTVHQAGISDFKIYKDTISDATKTLALQASKKGIKRFIYLSSMAVYGKNCSELVLSEINASNPNTPYGQAKLKAEEELLKIQKNTDLEIVIIRPPLVYGPNAPGNYDRLKKLIKKVPILPFGRATKKRSFISVDYLCDFMIHCAKHPNAAGKVFNVTDPTPLSTRDLCSNIGDALNKKTWQIPIPRTLMRYGLTLCKQRDTYEKLFEPMLLNTEKATSILGWGAEV